MFASNILFCLSVAQLIET